jgi:hypothetical protein
MPSPLFAVAAMMPDTCVPWPTKSLSEPFRKFWYSEIAFFRSGCCMSIPLSTTAIVMFVAFLNPVASRA